MTDVLAELEAMIGGMNPAQVAELDKLIADELKESWLPNPGPQSAAYFSEADLLLYGGAAGGGKTDLLLGLANTQHKRSVIFRRAYVDLRGVEERLIEIVGSREGYNGADMVYRRNGRMLECGALERPGAELSWQGRPHDFIGFDEGAQLSAAKVHFVLGWLRSKDEADGQRCRAVIASNPPMAGEGEWLIEWFAPWLDPMFANPAMPGELRWAITVGAAGNIHTSWVDGPGPVEIDGKSYTPMSRTFIPALLNDNPYLRDTGYRARIENMPEPLRSQLLNGDFLAGREDHEWQVIPSAWIEAAQERWERAEEKRRTMLALAGDVALGGKDNTVLAPLYEDNYFGELIKRKGTEFTDPADIATLMLQSRRDEADVSVDGTGGWGSGVASNLKNNHGIDCHQIVFSAGSDETQKDGDLGFANLRAEMHWRFREALDPESGEDVKLPPDQRLKAQLATPRYRVRGTDILVESKEEVIKRAGSSPDESDAVIMAWRRRNEASKRKARQRPPVERHRTPNSWMGAGGRR